MKHDRAIINARGGPWATIADAVRAQTEAIIRTGRPVSKPAAPAECDKLARRRAELGLTLKGFARAAKLGTHTVYTVEVGTSGTEALQRYRAALERLEEESHDSRHHPASETKS